MAKRGGPGGFPTARDFLTCIPTGRHFSPALPSDCFAIDFPRRAINPDEDLPILYTSLSGSGRGCPLLRASDDAPLFYILP